MVHTGQTKQSPESLFNLKNVKTALPVNILPF